MSTNYKQLQNLWNTTIEPRIKGWSIFWLGKHLIIAVNTFSCPPATKKVKWIDR